MAAGYSGHSVADFLMVSAIDADAKISKPEPHLREPKDGSSQHWQKANFSSRSLKPAIRPEIAGPLCARRPFAEVHANNRFCATGACYSDSTSVPYSELAADRGKVTTLRLVVSIGEGGKSFGIQEPDPIVSAGNPSGRLE